MTSRERVLTALEHRQPDTVAVDFGGTGQTGIAASLLYKLRKALCLRECPIKVIESYTMMGEIDEDLREVLECDCISLIGYKNMFGFRNSDWKPWTFHDGTPLLVPGFFNTNYESDGRLFQYPQGDMSNPPSGVMPAGGYFFDAIIRQQQFDEDNPDIRDNIEEFGRISEEELEYAQKEAEALRKHTDYAVVGGPGGMSLGDIAWVPGVFMKNPKGIRDIEEWYVSLAIRPDFIKEIFDFQTTIAVENLKLYYQAVGDNIDIVYLCGTDFGTQNSLLCSVDTFEDIYLPYYQRMTDWIHKNTTWKVYKHCCGSIRVLIPSMIKAGFDILNPMQNSAVDMDPCTLKEEFGNKITFWGGGVDTQHVLPFGTPQEVYDQVTERIKIYNKQGGFIFNTIHATQADVPVENFLAMIDAIKQFR
jgi:hypothetical protein